MLSKNDLLRKNGKADNKGLKIEFLYQDGYERAFIAFKYSYDAKILESSN